MADSELRLVGDNPWYWLATLHGEQQAYEFDDDLHKQNYTSWNRWMSTALSEEARANLIKSGIEEIQLKPFSEEEKNKFLLQFRSRSSLMAGKPLNPTEKVCFQEISFEICVSFKHFIFPRLVDFTSAIFSEQVDFAFVVFCDWANFKAAKFSHPADFQSSIFLKYTTFNSCQFSGVANFKDASFHDHADFDSAIFSREAVFQSVVYKALSNFSSITFHQQVNFDNANFVDRCSFSRASFFGLASFQSSKFHSSASFESATFHFLAKFDSVCFVKDCDFRKADIKFQIIFMNAEFKAKTLFSGADFETHVPDFRGAKLHEATEWHNITWLGKPPEITPHLRNMEDGNGCRMKITQKILFMAKSPFLLIRYLVIKIMISIKFMLNLINTICKSNKASKSSALQNHQDQIYAYEKLKQEMERLKKHEDEQFFFRKELRARRGLMIPGSAAWLLNVIYEMTSDYGNSILRPTTGILVLFVIGYVVVEVGWPVNGKWMHWPQAVLMSFTNIFSFLPTRPMYSSPGVPKMTTLFRVVQFVCALQSLLGGILLFLLGLALRNRFRMR